MTLSLLCLSLTLGCAENGKPGAQKADSGPPVVLKPELLQPLALAAKPDAALSVREVLDKPDGEKVIVCGVTPPATVRPFNAALAAFVLITPEDAAKPDVKAEFSCDDAATCPKCRRLLDSIGVRVELTDAAGAPIASSLEGYSGLKPGDPLTVEGVVKRDAKNPKRIRLVATRFFPG